MRGSHGSRGLLHGGARLRVVNDGKNLAALDPVAFLHADLDDIAHRLAGQLGRLRGAHRPHRFEPIGNCRALGNNHGNAADRFRRNGRNAIVARTPKHPAAQSGDQQRKYRKYSVPTLHGVTTGD